MAPISSLDGEFGGSDKLSRRLASADYVPAHKSSEPHVMYYELSDDKKKDPQDEDGPRLRTNSSALKPNGSHNYYMIGGVGVKWVTWVYSALVSRRKQRG